MLLAVIVIALLPAAAGCAQPKDPLTRHTGERGDSAGVQDTAGSQDTAVDLIEDDVVAYPRMDRLMELTGSVTLLDDGTALEGEVSYFLSLDGETRCDAVIALTGTTYSGECTYCDYAFSIDPEIIADAGSEDCTLDPLLTYVPSGVYRNLGWAFASDVPYDHQSDVDQTVMTLFYRDYTNYGGYYRDRLYKARVAYNGASPKGYLTYGDGSYTWGLTEDGVRAYTNNLDECGFTQQWIRYLKGEAYGYTLPPVYGSIPCGDTVYMDIWQVGAHAGDLLSVTVDTIAADRAFEPFIWLNNPEDCSVISSRWSFRCSEGRGYGCPSLQWTAEMDGPYEISLIADECASDLAEYKLMVAIE